MTIGILDWGIGGIGVLRSLRSRGIADNVVYLSDAGCTPYGKMERRDLRERLERVSRWFLKQGVYDVVVACNAASCALEGDDELHREEAEKPGLVAKAVHLRGIVPAAVAALTSTSAHTVGVIGGAGTITSGVYQARLAAAAPDRMLRFASAQPLSALVEAGQLDGPEVEAAVRNVLVAVGRVDALLLACTHYPALAGVFRRLGVHELLDPAELVVAGAPLTMDGDPGVARANPASPGLRFVTTGEADTAVQSARKAFGVSVGTPEVISLDLAEENWARAVADDIDADVGRSRGQ